MAWQKTKIWLVAKLEVDGKKLVHKIAIRKSKGTNKTGNDKQTKLQLRKFCNITRKHELYTESKF